MNTNIDFNILLKKCIPFIIIILSAMILNMILFLFLPKYYFINISQESKIIDYKKYKFKENFEEKKVVERKQKKKEKKKEYTLISNIILKMIYQEENNSGWIVIAEKSSKVTIILGVNELYKSYKLYKIFDKYVIFIKNNKEYKLSLNMDDKKTSYIVEDIKKKNSIEKINDQYYLKRDLITEYTKNSGKIWKEISIKETMKNGVIDGFKITQLPKSSIFNTLGLKKDDIIKSVNNIKLKSYADAFKLYKKIGEVNNLSFTILRGNEEMELEYEIK